MKPSLHLVPAVESYDIDKGIPIPRRTHASRYPFDDMAVGDSFFIACDTRRMTCIRAAVKHRAETRAEKYVTRKKPNGIRVWRVA